VSADEFDQHPFESISHVNNQSVLVAANIKYNTIVGDEVGGRSKIHFHIVWPLPIGTRNAAVPRPQRRLSFLMLLPEFF
jgi:hypothetical protein